LNELPSPKLTASQQQAKSVSRAIREGSLWVLGAVGVIILVALWSYSPDDPGFTSTGDVGEVSNAMGAVGAWIADVFYFLVGRSAFLIPILIFFAAINAYRHRDELLAWTRRTWVARTVGLVLTIITSSSLSTLHFASHALPHGAGGIVGDGLGLGLANNFSFTGATILMLAFWLTGVSLFTGLSWMKFSESVGRFVLNGIDKFKQKREEKKEAVEFEKVKEIKIQERFEIQREFGLRVEKERQTTLFETSGGGALPELSLLDLPKLQAQGYSKESLEAMSSCRHQVRRLVRL